MCACACACVCVCVCVYVRVFIQYVACTSFQLCVLPRLHITSGVPLGSVLGPSLFSIFINDLPSVLPTDSVVLFADDSAIYIARSNLSSLNSSLQLCLNLANTWIARNGLKLNASKTKCMLIPSSRKVADGCLSLETDGEKIEQVRVFKYLGVMINDTLTWSDHVNMVCKKASYSLNLLRRLSWFFLRSLLLFFLKSYILPIFDCDAVWSSCTTDEAQRLETLLNFGCKLVLNRSHHSSSATAHTELNLMTLALRRQLHLAQCTFRCLSSLSPPYLSKLFSYPSRPGTRSTSTTE